MQALLARDKSTQRDDVPYVTRKLVHLRASQINGCSVCVDMHSRELKKAGETDERLFEWQLGEIRPTSPALSGPRSRLPKPSPGSATGRTRYRMRSGTRLPAITPRR